jgi:signal transduction histidine kinase
MFDRLLVFSRTILLLVVVVSRTVEKQERLWFRATRLLAAESEAMAQYESFWRTADADRHASDLQVAKARTALDIRNQTTAFLFHEIRNPLHALHGAVPTPVNICVSSKSFGSPLVLVYIYDTHVLPGVGAHDGQRELYPG